MRHPFGSTCRVTRECKITTRTAIPAAEPSRASIEIAQGLREAGRRAGNLESGIFSMLSDCSPVGAAPVSRSDDDEGCVLDGRGSLSIDPFRACAGFQLKLPDRRLLADDGLELSGLARWSSFLWLWLGATELSSGWFGVT